MTVIRGEHCTDTNTGEIAAPFAGLYRAAAHPERHDADPTMPPTSVALVRFESEVSRELRRLATEYAIGGWWA